MIPQLGIITSGIKFKAAALAVMLIFSPATRINGLDINPAKIKNPVQEIRIDVLGDKILWDYLRAGINYVEASGEDVPTDFIHPGGVAYGPLALTRIAIKDVIIHYKEMEDYDADDILDNKDLYERCGKLYADLLLRHYLKISMAGTSQEDVFEILQKAWFLGPTIFRQGGQIPTSRRNNAREYIELAKLDKVDPSEINN